MFGEQTIERLLLDSYRQPVSRATVTIWHMLSTERSSQQRLRAVIQAEHREFGGLPGVLFLCVHNADRSQMALGWFGQLAAGRACPSNSRIPSAEDV